MCRLIFTQTKPRTKVPTAGIGQFKIAEDGRSGPQLSASNAITTGARSQYIYFCMPAEAHTSNYTLYTSLQILLRIAGY